MSNSSVQAEAVTTKPAAKKRRAARRPGGQIVGQMIDSAGNLVPLMMTEFGDNFEPGQPEFVGGHLGPRTRLSHPWSYDPILQYRTGEEATDSVYSDRLAGWYSHEVVKAAKERHFGSQSDYYSSFKPAQIQAFLRELLNKPNLKLVRIEEHCNQATGYPCWFFAFRDSPESIVDAKGSA